MIGITLCIFIICAVAALFYYKKDILGPWFLMSAMMVVSFSIVILNKTNWEVVIVPKFTIYCSIALFSWFVGSLFVRLLCANRKVSFQRHSQTPQALRSKQIKDRISEGSYPYLFLMCLSAGLTFVYLRTKLPEMNITSVQSFMAALRSVYDTEKTYGFFKTQVFELITVIAYISLFKRMSVQYLRPDRRMRIRLDIPVGLFLLCALVSTDRNILLRFMIYFVVLFIMFFREQLIPHITRKLVFRVGILVFMVAGVFFVFGAAKQYTSNVERAIGLYGGSGLYNFNLWLQDFTGPLARGKYTFADMQNALSALHLASPSIVSHNAEFITYVSENGYTYSSNIYSAMRFYVQDFGVWGVIVMPCLTGAFYEVLYVLMKRRPYGFTWIFYACMIYPAIYYPILEQFMKRMHFGRIYEIGWLVVFYFILFSAFGISKYRFKRRGFVFNRFIIKIVSRYK